MKQDTLKQPFFAQLLENQQAPEEKEGFWNPTITKPILDLEQTQKYPSDGDDIY
jgi:hypothetical protein